MQAAFLIYIVFTNIFLVVVYFIGRRYGFRLGLFNGQQISPFMSSYLKVVYLVNKNALHKKRFTRLQDEPAISILVHAAEELDELRAAPDDIEELADLLAILFHYMVYKGWTPAQVDDAILKKLAERFYV